MSVVLQLLFALGAGGSAVAAGSSHWVSHLFGEIVPVGSAAAGIVTGQVVFDGGIIPRPAEIENLTDPQYCGTRHSLEDVIISRKNRGIKNVILALAMEVAPPGSALPPKEKLILNNRNCRFEPHAAVLRAGGVVEAVNGDKIFHTTHLYYGPLSKNLALGVGDKAAQAANRPGFIIVKCDIHGWMKAFVRVDNHPFHAVSDVDGRFDIRGIPEGSYTLEVWHEHFGEQKVTVRVKAGQTENLTIRYGK